MTDTCEWIGKGEGCQHPVVEGRSYCQDHLFLVYQQGTALGRRKKDIKRVDNIREIETLMNEAIEELIAEGML